MVPGVAGSHRPCAAEAGRKTMSLYFHEGNYVGFFKIGTIIQDLRMKADALRWYRRIRISARASSPRAWTILRNVSHRRICRATCRAARCSTSGHGTASFRSRRSGAAQRKSSPETTTPGMARAGGPGGKAGFQLARDVLSSRVEDCDIDVMELSPARVRLVRRRALPRRPLPSPQPSSRSGACGRGDERPAHPGDRRGHG